MSRFEIQKGVPIPKKWIPNRKGQVESLKKMEIGDSFELGCESMKEANRTRANIASAAARMKIRICTRFNPERQILTTWRLE